MVQNTSRRSLIGLTTGAAVLVLALTSCASAGAPSDSTAAGDEQTVIRIAAGVGAPPYGDLDTDGKTVVSYEADLLNAIAKQSNLKLEWTVLDFDSMFPALDSGREDMISFGIIDRTSRQAKYDILDNAKDESGFIGAPELATTLATLDDVCGYKVGVSAGTSYVGFLEDQSSKCVAAGKEAIQVLTFKNEAVALTALNGGQVDLMSTQYAILTTFAEKSGGALAVAAGATYLPGYTGWVFPKDSANTKVFQDGLQALIESGEYEKIMSKWGLSDLGITSAELNQGTAE